MKTNDTPQGAGNQNRRGFLKTGAASLAVGLSAGVIASRASGEVTSTENSPAAARAIQDMMPTRNLGKTGFRAGIFGLGGQGALEKANNESLGPADDPTRARVRSELFRYLRHLRRTRQVE